MKGPEPGPQLDDLGIVQCSKRVATMTPIKTCWMILLGKWPHRFCRGYGLKTLTRGKVATVVEPDDAVRVPTHPIYNNEHSHRELSARAPQGTIVLGQIEPFPELAKQTTFHVTRLDTGLAGCQPSYMIMMVHVQVDWSSHGYSYRHRS